jgi:hypothetical protein
MGQRTYRDPVFSCECPQGVSGLHHVGKGTVLLRSRFCRRRCGGLLVSNSGFGIGLAGCSRRIGDDCSDDAA